MASNSIPVGKGKGKQYYYTWIILVFAFVFMFGFEFGSCALIGIGNEACININVNVTLSYDLYMNSCPEAEAIVFSWVEKAVSDDPRMAASLLRLHFHDCFVNGCDASVLVDDTESMEGEKSAGPNANSLRGFQVIDAIKAEMEYFCPQTVSCADILAIAARDAVLLSGGPRWEVEMGRRDGMISSNSKAAANSNIPAPNSDLPTLLSKFNNVGLSLKHLVALSGAHTIGKVRCSTFTTRLDGSSSNAINNLELLHSLQQLCGSNSNSNSNSTSAADLDYASPTVFDNGYYVNLLSGDGLLPSDQALLMDDQARALVDSYARDLNLFFQDFAHSMLAMGALSNPIPIAGQIRRNCRIIN